MGTGEYIIKRYLFLLFFSAQFLAPLPVAGKDSADGDVFTRLLDSGQVLGSVYFGLRDSSLDDAAKAELDRIVEELSKIGGPFIVRVEGFSDSVLEKKMGILLSMQRAQAVKLYMARKYPELKVNFFMTGFGETRPVVPSEGESAEEARAKYRRVDLVAYPGISFFEGRDAVDISAKLKIKEETHPGGKRGDAEKVAKKEAPEDTKGTVTKAPESKEASAAQKPAPMDVASSAGKGAEVVQPAKTETRVAVKREKREVPPETAATTLRSPAKMEVVVTAKSFKRFVLSKNFFDEKGRFREEARSVLKGIMETAIPGEGWIFIDAAGSRSSGAAYEESLKKQIYMAQELIGHHGIEADRIFIKGVRSAGLAPEEAEGKEGEVYLYVPLR